MRIKIIHSFNNSVFFCRTWCCNSY